VLHWGYVAFVNCAQFDFLEGLEEQVWCNGKPCVVMPEEIANIEDVYARAVAWETYRSENCGIVKP